MLKKNLVENLSKGFIQQSSSLFAAPEFFTKKPDGGLQYCIDYQDMNGKMIKNQYPLRLIKEALNDLGKLGIYTNLDV